jgi:DNA-binding NtrC family response regulator
VASESVELVFSGVRPARGEDGNLDLVAVEGEVVRIRVSGLCAECPDLLSGPSDHEVVRPTDCLPAGVSLDEHLERIEAGLIAWALRATGGNKSRAAELLHIKRTTLADRISRLGGRLLETSGTSA